jgi:hypothetical protein
LVLGWKDFNGTPQFCSLPQVERKIERISPHPYPLPQGGCVITPVLLAIMQKYGKKIIEK